MSDAISKLWKTIDDLREAAKVLRNDPPLSGDPDVIELFISSKNAMSCAGIADRLEANLKEAGHTRPETVAKKSRKGPRVLSTEPDKAVEKKVVCREGCGATVAYVPNDVHTYNGRDMSGGPNGRTWIVCPNCNKQITLRSW